MPSDFLTRQRFFHNLKQQKLRHLQQTVVLHLFPKTQRAEPLDFSLHCSLARPASQRVSLMLRALTAHSLAGQDANNVSLRFLP